MKKAIMTMACMAATMAVGAQDIQLPTPDKSNPTTLFQALQKRSSSREFAAKDITDAQLSSILWAACGVNRPDEDPSKSKITVPSALNRQDIEVIVIRKDGAFRYLPAENKLQQISKKDLRKAIAGPQTFAEDAPVSLLLVSNHSKFADMGNAAGRMGQVDCGYVSQNIALACAAMGLENVPRMTMDAETLRKELNLDSSYDLILNQQIGYGK